MQPVELHAGRVMGSMKLGKTGYFLPSDWILWRGEGLLDAIKLSSGDHIQIEAGPEMDLSNRQSYASVWESLSRFEPLVGELRAALQERAPEPLTRGTVLRGAGWRQLFVELTAKCNERCVHCYAESSPLRVEALSWQEISGVIEDAKALGFDLVQLTGGDPLISPHCVDAVELARKTGIPQVEIYTNGLALRGRTYERLRELAPSFAFSFYSHDAETHDAITRTPGSHARTTQAIRRAIEDGLKVRIGVISMRQNRADATKTRQYLLSLGVAEDAIGFDLMRDVGRGDEMPFDEDASSEFAASSSVHSPRQRNFSGSAAVSFDGTVYPCIFSRHLPLGSIRETSLKEVLTSTAPIASQAESLLGARASWGGKLSCWECQTRSALLAGSCDA